MRERGFIALPLTAWIAVGGAAVLIALVTWGSLERSGRLRLKAEYAGFVAKVETAGKAAEKAKREKEAQDKRNKERTDAELKRLRATNQSLSDGLLNARAAGGYVPRASPGTGDPDLACFSRAELNAAIGQLDAEISGLALKGDQALTGLEVVRAWAQGR